MFKKIGRSLAQQFTLFVFLLFMLNGVIFLIADFGNDMRQARVRLLEEMRYLQSHMTEVISGIADVPFVAHPERLRIVDATGTPVYSGGLMNELPLENEEGFSLWTIGDEDFVVLTSAITENGEMLGYVQIAEPEHASLGRLPLRSLVYILVSVLISLLTYIVGRHFAKRSLEPAEQMLLRLEQFTQDASHELRTPLAVLGSSLDLALKTKQYREGIVSAKEDLKEISQLVDTLLELARSGNLAMNIVSVDVSTLVRDAALKFRPLADAAGIRLNLAIVTDVQVHADAGLLHQVLSNLLSNAIKFTKPGGVITVSLDKRSLQITDTGIGIAAADLPHIFERFYQADSSRSVEGFGLGLSLVQRIIDLHGWTIDVESDEGKGTTFTVFFKKKNHRNS